MTAPRPSRRHLLAGALAGGAALACRANDAGGSASVAPASGAPRRARSGYPVLVGSRNALPGMQRQYAALQSGADPLDVVIDVVKVAEADPNDDSVGLGGLPNEDGVVQLDAACMYGPRHKSGAVAALENILHPSEVARLVLERTDHCLLVGRDAYAFARAHGHEHVDLMTEPSRKKWLEWKNDPKHESDHLPPPAKLPFLGNLEPGAPRVAEDARHERRRRQWRERVTGTIHCSGLAPSGAIACTTTTSGLSWKIPGRVGDSPIVGAGLYCDQEAGSAGATGRGEACVLAAGSATIVELMRQGASPLEAGLELLRRVTRQTQRQARWQPELLTKAGLPSFGLNFYVLGLDGSWAGVTPSGGGEFADADPENGPRLEKLVALHG